MHKALNALKNARQQWLGVFFALVFCASAFANCPAQQSLQWGKIAKVVDGDTLHLEDGRKLRLIAINTPELARNQRPAQPLAIEAREAVQAFFAQQPRIGWHYGSQHQDHYGRELVHVFRSDGQSLSAYLIEQGLGWRIAIPPNLGYQACLQRLEASARAQRRGVWQDRYYPLRRTQSLSADDTGFQRVRGRVENITATRKGWWIDLPGLSLRINKAAVWQGEQSPERWLHRAITVRGWLIDRSDSEAARRGYAPLMMSISHPSMVEIDVQ